MSKTGASSTYQRLGAVIFDLDGTITDTLPIAFSAFRAAIAEFSDRPFTDDELIGYFGPSEEGIFQRLVPSDWQRCFERYLDEYTKRHVVCSKPFAGIEDILVFLRQKGVRLAIVTGKSPRAVAITLRNVNIAHYFDALETGSAEAGTKPIAIQRLAARWGIEPSRVAYVGDAKTDMEAANTAGVLAVGAAWSPATNSKVLNESGAAVIFNEVESFEAWLRSQWEE
jgi:phosphoglycolate phosphatase-like HAD superfamily hydrolase